MNLAVPDHPALTQLLKEALAETLHEQRALLHEVFAEVLEDLALAESIREGLSTPTVDRSQVLSTAFQGEIGAFSEEAARTLR